jgi:hypothetical protein
VSACRGVVAAGALIAALFGSAGAAAFQAWGLASGMSRAQAITKAVRAGWMVRPLSEDLIAFAPPGGRGSPVRAGFCGDVLVWLERDFESDAQYDAVLRRLWARLGPPREFDMVGDMGVGAYGATFDGAFRSMVALDWQRGTQRIRLKSALGWRSGMTGLARYRAPSMAFKMMNPCSED